jgi:predicted nucleic acid-binding protein
VIAVVDASPLCYLILVGEIDLLPQLFGQVIVPQAVILELQHVSAPEMDRSWAANLPKWISVEETPDFVPAGMEKLQAGERAAIVLAESIKADIIIIDEKAARQIAGQRGLNVTGVLGVIGEASTLGLLDLMLTIDRLRKTSFRCSPALFKATLDLYGGQQSK